MRVVCTQIDFEDPVFPVELMLIGTDGIGLASGIFEHLLSLEDSPKVIAATHFHEIFENEFLALRPRLQLGHMEVRVSEDSQELEDQVTYLYKYVTTRLTIYDASKY